MTPSEQDVTYSINSDTEKSTTTDTDYPTEGITPLVTASPSGDSGGIWRAALPIGGIVLLIGVTIVAIVVVIQLRNKRLSPYLNLRTKFLYFYCVFMKNRRPSQGSPGCVCTWIHLYLMYCFSASSKGGTDVASAKTEDTLLKLQEMKQTNQRQSLI